MRLARLAFALLGLALTVPVLTLSARAQTAPADTSSLRRIVLTDGNVYVGTVADETADPLIVITTDGVTRTFARSRVQTVGPLVSGRFYRLDPTRSRLILTPTARTIGNGRARLSALGYIVPNVAYGISDRVDVSATGFLSFAEGSGALPVLGVKATVVDRPGVQAALGVSLAIPVGDVAGGVAGAPFGVVTLGSEVRSVTVAVAGAFGADLTTGDSDIANGVVVSVGGEVQVSNSVKVLGEAVVPIAEGAQAFALLPGVRFFGSRFSIDVYGLAGVIASGDGDETIGGGLAPFLNASYLF